MTLRPAQDATRGALYVAFGERARQEATHSIKRLKGLPVAVIGDEPLIGNDMTFIPFDRPGPGARRAKLSMGELTPWDRTLYLDADTRPVGDISTGFDMLADGWELVLAHSGRQGYDVLGNVAAGERAITFEVLSCPEPLGLQAGVIFFRKCESVVRMFGAWREEWEQDRGQDQAALLRALWRVPVRVWVLGTPWNSEHGEIIQHKFGRVRR